MKINQVSIKNFKSLLDINLTLGQLTLIAGINSSGKSSFIQALLLIKENKNTLKNISTLKQTQLQHIGCNTLLSSGEYTELGNKNNLLSYDSSDDTIYFSIHHDDKSHFDILIESKANFDIKKSAGNHQLLDIFDDECFCYLKTNRTAPANDFPYSEEKISQNSIGLEGEYTAHYLTVKNHQALMIEALKHPKSITNQLLENTALWLSEISSGVSLSAQSYPELERVGLSYQYEYGDNTTGKLSPLQVGFGLTYILPVIVAILKAKPNDLVMIENPESHLHPKGQAKIAELCAIAANHGVQVIVETHSDHFLNGLRVATKNNIISPDKSQIYYFYKNAGELSTHAQQINIDNNGKLTDWPVGFFDEWDNQLDQLLW